MPYVEYEVSFHSRLVGVSQQLVFPITRSLSTLGDSDEDTLSLSCEVLVSLDNISISDRILHSSSDGTTSPLGNVFDLFLRNFHRTLKQDLLSSL